MYRDNMISIDNFFFFFLREPGNVQWKNDNSLIDNIITIKDIFLAKNQ